MEWIAGWSVDRRRRADCALAEARGARGRGGTLLHQAASVERWSRAPSPEPWAPAPAPVPSPDAPMTSANRWDMCRMASMI